MSGAIAGERLGALERLTSSTAFAVLLSLAAVALAPFLLFGLALLPVSLGSALVTMRPEEWGLVLLPLGGAAGVMGLVLTSRPPRTLAGYRIGMLCIVIGIATAIVLAGVLVTAAVDASNAWALSAVGIPVLAMPVLAALGRIARLWRARAAAEGRPQDALPLIFLAVALGALACAIALGVRLAIAG